MRSSPAISDPFHSSLTPASVPLAHKYEESLNEMKMNHCGMLMLLGGVASSPLLDFSFVILDLGTLDCVFSLLLRGRLIAPWPCPLRRARRRGSMACRLCEGRVSVHVLE